MIAIERTQPVGTLTPRGGAGDLTRGLRSGYRGVTPIS